MILSLINDKQVLYYNIACSVHKRATDPLELELDAVWVLGTEPKSSARALKFTSSSLAQLFTDWPISQHLLLVFFKVPK